MRRPHEEHRGCPQRCGRMELMIELNFDKGGGLLPAIVQLSLLPEPPNEPPKQMTTHSEKKRQNYDDYAIYYLTNMFKK